MFEVLLSVGLTYIFADLILALTVKRCVLPGLKCGACRKSA